jgi:hypothetical protein
VDLDGFYLDARYTNRRQYAVAILLRHNGFRAITLPLGMDIDER